MEPCNHHEAIVLCQTTQAGILKEIKDDIASVKSDVKEGFKLIGEKFENINERFNEHKEALLTAMETRQVDLMQQIHDPKDGLPYTKKWVDDYRRTKRFITKIVFGVAAFVGWFIGVYGSKIWAFLKANF